MNYFVKRVLQGLFTMWAIITITFVIVRWMPGGPLDYIRAQLILGARQQGSSSSESIERFNQMAQTYVNIAPDEPIYMQYVDYMTSVMQGDLGQSIYFGDPVSSILIPAIPWTIFLTSISIFISFVSLVIMGAALAYYEGSNFDLSITTLLVWMRGVPYFIVGILCVYVLAYRLSWFPTGGKYDPMTTAGVNWPFVQGLLHHAALPVLSLAWASFGSGALLMRANSISVLGEDYLRVAQLRGIQIQRLSLFYVARNAILPMYTGLMLSIGYMMGGAVILETIFQYTGVGYWMYEGILARDYPLMMGAFLLIAVSVVAALIVADLTYGIIDPRIASGESDETF